MTPSNQNSPAFGESADRALRAYLNEVSFSIVGRATAIAMNEGRNEVLAQDVVAALPTSEDEDYSQKRFRAESRTAAVRRSRTLDILNLTTAASGMVSLLAVLLAVLIQYRHYLDPSSQLAVYIAAAGAFTAGYSYIFSRVISRRRRSVAIAETSLSEESQSSLPLPPNLMAQLFELANRSDINGRRLLVAEFLDGWRRLEQSVQLAYDSLVGSSEPRKMGLRDSVLKLQENGHLAYDDVEAFLRLLRVRNQLVHSQTESPPVDTDALRAARNQLERLNAIFAAMLDSGGPGQAAL